jgi:hypothetical protein
MRRAAWLLLTLTACVGPEDTPTLVRDLRVLGISVEPPELMADACPLKVEDVNLNPGSPLLAWAQPVRITTLIADPQGGGRAIQYELRACAHPSDRTCTEPGLSTQLTGNLGTAGELALDATLGTTFVGSEPLLLKVFEQDVYKGLGGLRMPLVMHLTAGEEEIHAQKLMVFNCRRFPEMKQNGTPVVPGYQLEGQPWLENELPLLKGEGPFKIEPLDFSSLEESYVVPSYELQPVHLVESWKISWQADHGRLSRSESGGTDVGGQESRHQVEWTPRSDDPEQDVTFWMVVRDGRGGLSWAIRRAHYQP